MRTRQAEFRLTAAQARTLGEVGEKYPHSSVKVTRSITPHFTHTYVHARGMGFRHLAQNGKLSPELTPEKGVTHAHPC